MLDWLRNRAKSESTDGWVAFFVLTFAVLDTVRSIQLLARFGKSRDCLILARCVLETSVNTALAVSDAKFASAMKAHHAQKEFRDLQRNIDFMDMHFQTGPHRLDPDLVPEVASAVHKFTGRKGREITSWTPETLEARIAFLVAKYGRGIAGNLEVALFAIYRDASEILHGTSFGVTKSIIGSPGAYKKGSSDDLVRIRQAVLCEILFLTGGVLATLIQTAAPQLGQLDMAKHARDLVLGMAPILGLDLEAIKSQDDQRQVSVNDREQV